MACVQCRAVHQRARKALAQCRAAWGTRGAACNRNNRMRMGILAKARDDTMWRAWAARSGEER